MRSRKGMRHKKALTMIVREEESMRRLSLDRDELAAFTPPGRTSRAHLCANNHRGLCSNWRLSLSLALSELALAQVTFLGVRDCVGTPAWET